MVKFCSEQGIDYSQGPKFRWSISAHEANEALQAIAQLQDDGFKVSWLPSINGRHANFGPLLKGCQKEERAATVNVQELMQKLRQSIGSIANKGPALNLFQHKEGCIIESTEGQCRSELVICAAHLSIEHFIPELKNTLVSVADQWSEFELADSGLTWPWRTGTNFSWQHGYQWGVLNSSRSLRLGGGRFMRPLAGIEATSAVKEAKISSFLQESWHLLWPHLPLRPTGLGMAGLDFRPCDELPIIGPMFGQNRILVATGFMGQGLTLGFLGGRCLAEIIAGLPSHLPRFLWPERLRSLT